MVKARELLVVLVTFTALWGFVSPSLADAPKPDAADKQTVLGLYVDAAEAFQWIQDKKIAVVDVRAPEEIAFVGHTGLAPIIPVKLWKGEYVAKGGHLEPKMVDNERFVEEVSAKFKPEDTLIVLCRSGQRSAVAVNLLAKAGFKKAFTMVDGFEGDKAKDGPNKGKRTVNGWKNAGKPWTYSLTEGIVWSPGKSK
ncbi:MAG: rhodanese-like domain-containing protein [Pseudomonadota bacterium]